LSRLGSALALFLAVAALVAPSALPARAATEPGTVIVTYDSAAALQAALDAEPGRVVRTLPDLDAVEVAAEDPAEFSDAVVELPGIESVRASVLRYAASEPALMTIPLLGFPYEWQYKAAHVDAVPDAVLRAAASVTVAVVDTGGDLTAPDLTAKQPAVHNVLNGKSDVSDYYGHGTFVASIAAGSVTNNDGIAGFAGDARLLIVKAGRADGSFTDADEAAGIVYAVNHGAKVINLSLGGTQSSALERKALSYAAAHGVLVVAAAGNEYEEGNPIEYPAATLQPPRSNGRGGWGLAVGATTRKGKRAEFSNTGTYLSLAAPGDDVFGAISSSTDELDWPRYDLPGSTAGEYGFSSGTSFSAPQVAGAAALVWAANPALTRAQVAWVLKSSASGNGRWNRDLGYGILDVGRAVAMATQGGEIVPPPRALAALRIVRPRARLGARSSIFIKGRLRSGLPAISPAGRRVTLQSLRDGAWRRVAQGRTKAGGRVTLRVRLHSGRYVMRVKYSGEPELSEAVSSTFRLKVPRHVLRRA